MDQIIGYCYAAASGIGGFLVLYGQAIIIGVGLLSGLLFAGLYRSRTRGRRYQP